MSGIGCVRSGLQALADGKRALIGRFKVACGVYGCFVLFPGGGKLARLGA